MVNMLHDVIFKVVSQAARHGLNNFLVDISTNLPFK